MRVIAGTARGTRLVAPRGRRTRPTSDRAKEGLFSSLQARWPGAVVLDVYAGSGALGIEALSRGAAHAVFVERDPRAVACLRTNLERARVGDRATVRPVTVEQYAPLAADRPFDVVVADPPYDASLSPLWKGLEALREAGRLAPDAVVVVERDRRRSDPGEVPGFLALQRERAYGDTVLQYLQVVPR